jgi:hypothetical protein
MRRRKRVLCAARSLLLHGYGDGLRRRGPNRQDRFRRLRGKVEERSQKKRSAHSDQRGRSLALKRACPRTPGRGSLAVKSLRSPLGGQNRMESVEGAEAGTAGEQPARNTQPAASKKLMPAPPEAPGADQGSASQKILRAATELAYFAGTKRKSTGEATSNFWPVRVSSPECGSTRKITNSFDFWSPANANWPVGSSWNPRGKVPPVGAI